MDLEFVTDYNSILEKLDQIDPVKYASSRNYADGAVTYLSPYISRGVISTKQVLESVLKKGYKISQIETFVKELCWRDYFQRVAQLKDLNREIKQLQTPILNYEISSQIIKAATGIEGIDNAINQLYQTGYMHNHCRMYTSALVCNIAKSHWYHPAQWMYYHLLDGDWASNACSWQWVAGANSSKKYYANQENINKYSYTNQYNTYLDKPYEALENMQTPVQLLATEKFSLATELPENKSIQYKSELPTFLYNYYNLDPLWHKAEKGNRIFLIEPSFFSVFPVSKKCIDFMLALSKNIPDIQLYVGSFQSFSDNYDVENSYYKEHPLNSGYSGTEEERDWIVEEVSGYYPSFFAYWKKVNKHLYK
jgi:deoxyribodipyrimidine photo-lyase